MREYVFNARAMSWSKDERGFVTLVVCCHESEDARLVINCGAHQQRLVNDGAPEGMITDVEKPCA
jgi:hypothetical protein